MKSLEDETSLKFNNLEKTIQRQYPNITNIQLIGEDQCSYTLIADSKSQDQKMRIRRITFNSFWGLSQYLSFLLTLKQEKLKGLVVPDNITIHTNYLDKIDYQKIETMKSLKEYG